jgi:hypothetical protein
MKNRKNLDRMQSVFSEAPVDYPSRITGKPKVKNMVINITP